MSALASYLVAIGWNSQEASFVGVTQDAAITATGTTQATAYPLVETINNINLVTSGVIDGVRLPAIAQHKHAWILVANNDDASALNLYPATGESIMSLAVDLPISIPIATARLLFPVSTTKWMFV